MDLGYNLTLKAVCLHASSFLINLFNFLWTNTLEAWTCLDAMDPDFPSAGSLSRLGSPQLTSIRFYISVDSLTKVFPFEIFE